MTILRTADQSRIITTAGERTERTLDEQRFVLMSDYKRIFKSQFHLGIYSEDHQFVDAVVHQYEFTFRIIIVNIVLNRSTCYRGVFLANAFGQSRQTAGGQIE